MYLCLQTLLHTSQSLGGMARQLPVINFVLLQLQAPALLGTPCRQTIRLWLWRLGLYLLQRSVARCQDWIWIIDHTLQWGCRRAFVVLGIRRAQLQQSGYCLRADDVQLLLVDVVEHSDGPCVQQQLQTLAQRVGVPQQIVSDHGSDIAKGVQLFRAACPEQQQVIDTYDVTHKLACLLKAMLEPDPRWLRFSQQCAQTGQQLRQTKAAFLQPPTPRPKARFMNLDTQVQWATRMLRLQQRGRLDRLAAVLGQSSVATQQWLSDKLGWLQEFAADVATWSELLWLTQQVRQQVRQHGLGQESPRQFRQHIRPRLSEGAAVQRLAQAVESYLQEQGQVIPAGQQLLGSSEVIESVFGKYKGYLERSRWPEIGSNVLLLPVLLCSWGLDTLATALQAVSCAKVAAWVTDEFGASRQAHYRQVLGEEKAEPEEDKPPPARPQSVLEGGGRGGSRAPPQDKQVA
jgi:hypothetical protein